MLRSVLLLLLASVQVFAEDHALVRSADVWRYLPIINNSPLPENNWTFPGYDDSTWRSGVASFYTPGGGLLGWPEATLLPYEGASSYIFRKQFQVANPESIRSLILRIDYEHGFVAYLNGTEAARRGFPTSASNAVPLTASALYHPRGNTEFVDLSGAIPSLTPGTNVLAIQVHSAGVEDPDIVLSAALSANFSRGPFVENATTNSIQVIWKTIDETTGFVVFGDEHGQNLRTEFSLTPGTTHAVTLTSLQAGQLYSYRVYSERDGGVAATDRALFRTLKPPGQPITFLVFGDTGQATVGQYAIANQMLLTPADLVVHVGDIVYPYFNDAWADARCFDIYRDQMRSVPFFFCMGNHDGILNLTDFMQDFYLPTNTANGTEHFYSFDHGDAHFVILATDTLVGQRYNPGSPQYNWLEADLAGSAKPWKFIFFHHVIRSSSLHSADDYLFDGTLDKYALQMFIGGLAERYGAQVIFNGHDHDYERFAAFNGANSFVSGGGGAALYPQFAFEPGSMQFFTRHNFLKATVDGSQMTVEAIDDTGAVFDRFYRSTISASDAQSKWGSPLIEDSTGDASGNIPGQRFPFFDPGVPTAAGLQGNLGRLHFRNDNDNLYIGLEQAALHDNQVIALFIENPSAPGVSDLAPLGNQLMDTNVDGLDLLQTLDFKNFHPSIGCLLGDELADGGSFRDFKRPGLRWATGQGVFNMDAELTSVPGIHLQQFNRSPQSAPQFRESNADFISLAIPLAALGHPTNSIQLGAIIFSDPEMGPMEPEIDTAYAGRSLVSEGGGRFLLEPMTVTLDADPFSSEFNFRATWISPSQIRFTWLSNPGAQYWLQTTPDLSQPFRDSQNPAFPFTAAGASCILDLDARSLATPQFFRLRTN